MTPAICSIRCHHQTILVSANANILSFYSFTNGQLFELNVIDEILVVQTRHECNNTTIVLIVTKLYVGQVDVVSDVLSDLTLKKLYFSSPTIFSSTNVQCIYSDKHLFLVNSDKWHTTKLSDSENNMTLPTTELKVVAGLASSASEMLTVQDLVSDLSVLADGMLHTSRNISTGRWAVRWYQRNASQVTLQWVLHFPTEVAVAGCHQGADPSFNDMVVLGASHSLWVLNRGGCVAALDLFASHIRDQQQLSQRRDLVSGLTVVRPADVGQGKDNTTLVVSCADGRYLQCELVLSGGAAITVKELRCRPHSPAVATSLLPSCQQLALLSDLSTDGNMNYLVAGTHKLFGVQLLQLSDDEWDCGGDGVWAALEGGGTRVDRMVGASETYPLRESASTPETLLAICTDAAANTSMLHRILRGCELRSIDSVEIEGAQCEQFHILAPQPLRESAWTTPVVMLTSLATHQSALYAIRADGDNGETLRPVQHHHSSQPACLVDQYTLAFMELVGGCLVQVTRSSVAVLHFRRSEPCISVEVSAVQELPVAHLLSDTAANSYWAGERSLSRSQFMSAIPALKATESVAIHCASAMGSSLLLASGRILLVVESVSCSPAEVSSCLVMAPGDVSCLSAASAGTGQQQQIVAVGFWDRADVCIMTNAKNSSSVPLWTAHTITQSAGLFAGPSAVISSVCMLPLSSGAALSVWAVISADGDARVRVYHLTASTAVQTTYSHVFIHEFALPSTVPSLVALPSHRGVLLSGNHFMFFENGMQDIAGPSGGAPLSGTWRRISLVSRTGWVRCGFHLPLLQQAHVRGSTDAGLSMGWIGPARNGCIGRLHWGFLQPLDETCEVVCASVRVDGAVSQLRVTPDLRVALLVTEHAAHGDVVRVAVYDSLRLDCLWSQVLTVSAVCSAAIVVGFGPPKLALRHPFNSSFSRQLGCDCLTLVRRSHAGMQPVVNVVVCKLDVYSTAGGGTLTCTPFAQRCVPVRGVRAVPDSLILVERLGRKRLVAAVSSSEVAVMGWTDSFKARCSLEVLCFGSCGSASDKRPILALCCVGADAVVVSVAGVGVEVLLLGGGDSKRPSTLQSVFLLQVENAVFSALRGVLPGTNCCREETEGVRDKGGPLQVIANDARLGAHATHLLSFNLPIAPHQGPPSGDVNVLGNCSTIHVKL